MLKISFIEIAPIIFILLFLVFALLQQTKKKNAKSIAELKEQNPENWKKAVKSSAIFKSIGWCLLGVMWIGIVALNLSSVPAGNEITAVFMSSLGIFFVAIGIWNYFREMKKIRN